MSNRYLASDHHFAHDKIYGFKDNDGHLIRPWASSAEEGDEMMIDAWNKEVNKRDTVIHFGDIVVKRTGFKLLERLNGRIILIRGNHDIFPLKDYLPYVADIRGTHKKDHVILSHYPIHPASIPNWAQGVIHGHTHQNHVLLADGTRDPRYLNLCVEAVGITPIAWEDAIRRLPEIPPEDVTDDMTL